MLNPILARRVRARRRGHIAVAASLAAAAAGIPLARGDEAATAASEGDRLTAAGDHRAALDAYRRAATLDPGAAPRLCSLGLAHDHLGDAARAYVYLDRCATAGEPPLAARQARDRRRKELEAGNYGLVVVSSQPTIAQVTVSFLLGDPPLAAPLSLYLPIGKHTVTVTADGYQPFETAVEITGRERRAVMAQLAAPSQPAGKELAFEEDESGAAGNVITAPDPRPKQHVNLIPDRLQGKPEPSSGGDKLTDPDPVPLPTPPRSPLPWFMLGGGALFIGGGVAFSIAAGAAADDRDALPPDVSHVAADDRVRARKTGAVVCYAFGAAGLGIGAYLLIRGPRTRAGARVSGDGSGAVMTLSHDW